MLSKCFAQALLWYSVRRSALFTRSITGLGGCKITEITEITKISKTEWSGDYKNRMKWWLQKQNKVVIAKTEWSGDYKNRMTVKAVQCSAVGYTKISSCIEYHKIEICCIISYIAWRKIISYNTTYHIYIMLYHIISYPII